MDQESVELEVDPRSVLTAIKQANTAVEGWEKQTIGSGDKMQKSLERMGDMLLKINDKSRNSMERLTQSIEKQAAAYGKTGVERLVAERDRLIKKLGDEQGMIERVTAAYAKMIQVEGGGGGGSWQAMGRNIEQFVRDPMNGAKDAAGGLLAKIGPMGAALGATTGVIVGFAVAGWEAAKSLGEYGTQIENTAIRMGLTTKEVGQFTFAAKAAGTDISAFESTMRKLSQGLADGGSEGKRTREALRDLGIEARNADGSMKPMSGVFLQLSERLSAITDPAKRDAEAIRLFGRAGVEVLPAIMALSEHVKRAKELGLGASEEEVARWKKYHETITEADAVWDRLVRKIKEPIAATVIITYRWAARGGGPGQPGVAESTRGGGVDEPGIDERDLPIWNALRHNMGLYAPGAGAIPGLQTKYVREGMAQSAASRNLKSQLESGLEGAKSKLDELKTAYDNAKTSAQQLAANTMVLPETANKAWTEVEKARVAYQGQSDIVKELEKDESKRVSLLEKMRDLIRQGQGFYQIGTGPQATIVTSEQIAAANQIPARPPTLFGRREVNPFAAVSAVQGEEQALGGLKPGLQVVPGGGMAFVMGPSTPGTDLQQLDARMKGQVGAWEQQDRMQASAVAAGATLATQQVELGLSLRKAQMRGHGFDRGDDIETIKQVADLREQALKWELALTGDIGKYRQESLQNELQMRMKIAEEENREAEDQERKVQALQQKTEGLLHTLFTKPGSFGAQLRGTVRDALLKPIEEGMGGMVASTISPVIYGSEGKGGIAGMFRGMLGTDQHNPVKVSTDLNTAVTAQNSAALAALTAVVARSMGISAPSISVPSIPGIGSMSIPNIGVSVAGGASSGGAVDWLRGLPRFAEGGVTSGPSIAGEAGPELVIPLSEIASMKKQASVLRGPSPPDTAEQYRGFLGLLREYNPHLADWIGKTAREIWNDKGVQMLPGPMAIEIEVEELGAMALRDAQGAAKGWERGDIFHGKTVEELRQIGAKGGKHKLTPEQYEEFRDRMDYSSKYEGPEIGRETTHEASKQIDALFPHLAKAFEKTEADKARQEIGRMGGKVGGGANRGAAVRAARELMEMRLPPDPKEPLYIARWVINPNSGEIALTKIGKFDAYRDYLPEHHELIASKGWPTSGRAYDLMHRGVASIARDGTILDLGDQSGQGLEEFIATYGTRKGYRPINNDQAKDLIEALGEQFRKGAIIRKPPSYDDGGTVASTGVALVHAGEAVVPRADTLKLAIDANTRAIDRLGWTMTGVTASSMLLGGNLQFLGGNTAVTNLFNLISGPASASKALSMMIGGGGFGGGGGSATGGGGGAADINNLPIAQHGFNPLSLMMGGSGTAAAPGGFSPGGLLAAAAKGGPAAMFSKDTFSKMLTNMKGAVWNQSAWDAYPSTTAGYLAGGLQGVATSPAAGTAGMMLGMSGLFGSTRGTWTGAAESAAGGALIGNQVAGPLGAAAGASFGFEVSMFEKLFGVESQENEAKRLVKQMYSVSIDNSMAKQIVSLAQQKYAGHVSIAVRDPDVRKMLMLYSEATGQKMPLSATTPQSGSLAEMGGRLFQQATYVNGMPYTFQSSLPVAGGYATGTYPTPGPLSLQVNVSGQGAAQFVAGQVVTPDFVQSQWASAAAGSNGRVQNSAVMQQPGLVVS